MIEKKMIYDRIVNEKADDMMETRKEIDLKREKTMRAIGSLSLLDDDLMTLVFNRNIEATKLLLNIILQRNDLTVIEVVAQREYKNSMTKGRSIIIDICSRQRREDL